MEKFNINSMNELERLSLLYGVLLGDGCLSSYKLKSGRKRSCMVITGNLKDDRLFFEDVLIPLVSSFTGRKNAVKERPNWGSMDLNFSSKELFNRINSLGFNVGKKKDIAIPEIFEGELIKYLIAGLFSTDGCLTLVNNNGTTYPRLFITTSLPSALNKISNYLNKEGIKTGFYSAKRNKILPDDFKRTKQVYVICSNGKNNLNKFKDKIGFLNPKHEQNYQKYIDYLSTKNNGSGES